MSIQHECVNGSEQNEEERNGDGYKVEKTTMAPKASSVVCDKWAPDLGRLSGSQVGSPPNASRGNDLLIDANIVASPFVIPLLQWFTCLVDLRENFGDTVWFCSNIVLLRLACCRKSSATGAKLTMPASNAALTCSSLTLAVTAMT
jgi:hypothetical protein